MSGADEAGSTASDTESLACWRLSFVWDVESNPHPANQSRESVLDGHEDRRVSKGQHSAEASFGR